ncbi:MAG TPA: phosphoribosylanthranilate isomerase [Nitrospira sp.]|nr:phosphoribosylanthranilate isomerase [Nitrospira sp.]
MRQSVKVKVCGITNAEDARAAVEAGADALGFIFFEKSPRYVVPAVASQIIAELPPLVTAVGVFVNEGLATVRSIMDTCGLAMAQLHGDENASYCRELARPAMKALRLKDRGGLLALAEYQGRGGVRGFVLDTFSEFAYGGTGQLADWRLSAEVAQTARVLLAGGLTPENVAEAIRTVRPYGVDVSSGVESAPGKKDHAKVRAFLDAVRIVTSS